MQEKTRSFGWKAGGVIVKKPLILLRGRMPEERLGEAAAAAGALSSVLFLWRSGELSCALPPCGARILAGRMPVAETRACGAVTIFGLGLEDPDFSERALAFLGEAEIPFFGVSRSEIGWTVLVPEERTGRCAGLFSSLISPR